MYKGLPEIKEVQNSSQSSSLEAAGAAFFGAGFAEESDFTAIFGLALGATGAARLTGIIDCFMLAPTCSPVLSLNMLTTLASSDA